MWYGWLMSANKAPQARGAENTHIFEVDEGVANTNLISNLDRPVGRTHDLLAIVRKI